MVFPIHNLATTPSMDKDVSCCINNRKINKLYERCFQIIYKDEKSSFEESLHKDNSISNHDKNIQILARELHRIIRAILPSHMSEIFKSRNQ